MSGGINKTKNEWVIICRSLSQMLNLLVCAFYTSFGAIFVKERLTILVISSYYDVLFINVTEWK